MRQRNIFPIISLFSVVFAASYSVLFDARTHAELQQHNATLAYGLDIIAQDKNNIVSYGKYDSQYRYAILFDSLGNERAHGFVGLDGRVEMCVVHGGYWFGHVTAPSSIYIDSEFDFSNSRC